MKRRRCHDVNNWYFGSIEIAYIVRWERLVLDNMVVATKLAHMNRGCLVRQITEELHDLPNTEKVPFRVVVIDEVVDVIVDTSVRNSAALQGDDLPLSSLASLEAARDARLEPIAAVREGPLDLFSSKVGERVIDVI